MQHLATFSGKAPRQTRRSSNMRLGLDGDEVTGDSLLYEVDADVWSPPTGPLIPEPDVTELLAIVRVLGEEPLANTLERLTS